MTVIYDADEEVIQLIKSAVHESPAWSYGGEIGEDDTNKIEIWAKPEYGLAAFVYGDDSCDIVMGHRNAIAEDEDLDQEIIKKILEFMDAE